MMRPLQSRTYFEGYAPHKGRRRNRFQNRMKDFSLVGSWIKFTLLSLFLVGIVLPTPASTNHLHERPTGWLTQIHLLEPIDEKTALRPRTRLPQNILQPEYEFRFTNRPTSDLVTITLVNEVLWHLMTDDQVNQQGTTSLIPDAE